MAIKKQEFYEGAALHALLSRGGTLRIKYEAPFFHVNECFLILLKYSARKRSPWGFTFSKSEMQAMSAVTSRLEIGLICGADGVAALAFDNFSVIAGVSGATAHIACYRGYDQHYLIKGPEGAVDKKIPPSRWKALAEEGV
jgi:hypothetical protein